MGTFGSAKKFAQSESEIMSKLDDIMKRLEVVERVASMARDDEQKVVDSDEKVAHEDDGMSEEIHKVIQSEIAKVNAKFVRLEEARVAELKELKAAVIEGNKKNDASADFKDRYGAKL